VSVVYLSDHQSLLSRFTQGIAGRYLQLRCTDMLSGSFRPAGATTDGQAIYLPESIAEFDSPRRNLGLYRVSILHQLGYFLFGTFDFCLSIAESRIEALQHTPAASAATIRRHDDQPVDLERLFDRFENPALARRLFLVLEDYRIDCRLPFEFPGIDSDLAGAMEHALTERQRLPRNGSKLARLIEAMIDFSLGAERSQLVETDPTGLITELLAKMTNLGSADADVYDSVAAMTDCMQQLILFASQQRDIQRGHVDANGGPAVDADETLPIVSEQDLEIAGAGFRGDLLPELVQRQMRLADLIRELEPIESMGHELPENVLAEHLDQPGTRKNRGVGPHRISSNG